jgi:cytochrome c oxidase subunit 3
MLNNNHIGITSSNVENILYDKFNGSNVNPNLFVFFLNSFGEVDTKSEENRLNNLIRFLKSIRIDLSKVVNTLQRHTFHIVTPSPWPIYAALSAFVLLVSSAAYMHRFQGGGSGILLGFFLIIFSMFVWWRDVIRESTWQGYHTYNVQKGLRLGFALFIVSEVMFFFSIFWAFFHSSLSPAIELGSIWPPVGLEILDPWKIPALNTLILLMSGVTITLAHHGIIGKSGITHYGFLATVVLAVFFTSLQVFEYISASFDIADGVYGTTFFF